MNKKWIIRSWALVLVGIAGVGGVHLLKTHEQRETARYKQQSDNRADDYFGLYDDQGRVKSQKQLKLQQQVRLKADMADLAKGTKATPIYAEVLYGDNWHQEVSRYKNKMMLMDSLLGASAISILAGVIIGLIYLWRQVIPAVVAHFGQSRAEGADVCARDDGEAEANVVAVEQVETALGQPGPQHMPNTVLSSDLTAGYFGQRRTHTLADSLGMKDSLGRQAHGFGKDAAQFGPSGATEHTMLMSTEPVSNTLDELTQEVSAIREFAAQQQDRVKQLQEGYDWTIIKRFCLRIIRCIDNLDDRINSLAAQNKETQLLEDVRDELVFALESSGVEQFEPAINAHYKGLEKIAEAVREKEHAEHAGLSGKIAEVVRAGYRYVLNDDDVKIVRAAQVKLYG
ncbi:MAG: nucleotide exchange factor GrpE [Planctomycetota bacterium]|jgi:molecular chaperone GrpE (heat shock protein)